jgi:hypothetical protein
MENDSHHTQLVAALIVAFTIVVVTSQFGATSAAEREVQEERLEQQEERLERQEELREERLENR